MDEVLYERKGARAEILIDLAAVLDSLQNFPKPRVTPTRDTDEGVDMVL